ncbi:MAG: response regulator transcription factor [Bacteroidia bacterium]
MISIIVLEDHDIVVEGLFRVLEGLNEYSLDYHAKTISEFNEVLEKQVFDFAIIDINVSEENALESLQSIKHKYPNLEVIVFSMYGNPSFVKKAKDEGASAYLLKTIESDELLTALNSVKQKRFYLSADITEQLLRNDFDEYDEFSAKSKLSKREFQIAKLYASIADSNVIASKLSISKFTLKQHRRNIYKKLNINSIAQLVKYFDN